MRIGNRLLLISGGVFVFSVGFWFLTQLMQKPPQVIDFYITNQTPTSADVIWTIDRKIETKLIVLPVNQQGEVNLSSKILSFLPIRSGLRPQVMTKPGSFVHMAHVDKLKPVTGYEFRLKAGPFRLIKPERARWQTPKVGDQPPALVPAYSQVKNKTGKPLSSAVVLMYRPDMMTKKVAAMTDSKGFWRLNAGLLDLSSGSDELILEVIAPDGQRRLKSISSRFISPALVIEFGRE